MMNAYSLRIFLRAIRWLPAIRRARQGTSYTSADLIENSARRFGERVFVEFEGRTTSYAGFNREANRVAHWALERGLGKGDVVALMMENRPEYLGIWAGLAKAGVTTALINTHLGGHSLEHVIEAAGCRALILGDECLPAYRELAAQHLKGLPVFVSRRDGSIAQPDADAGEIASLDAELRRFPTENPPASARRIRCSTSTPPAPPACPRPRASATRASCPAACITCCPVSVRATRSIACCRCITPWAA